MVSLNCLNSINLKTALILFTAIFIISCNDEAEDGLNGVNVLYQISEESSGDNCSTSGIRIEFGQDINDDGTLDSSEIQGSTFICGGINAGAILVETIDEPAGENCQDGGVKLLIGMDQNENAELDTEEVDEILFVCNGEIAAVKGKTFVVLSGDITNEEAAAKIAQEVGSNTQFISILFTDQLTSVDLSMVSELVEFRIEENLKLESIDISNLVSISDQFIVVNNTFTELDISSLQSGRIVVFENNSLSSLDLSNLAHVREISIDEPVLTELNLGFNNAKSFSINSTSLVTLDLSFLNDEPDLDINITGGGISAIDFSNLTALNSLRILNTALDTLHLEQLVTCGSWTINSNLQLASLEANNLVAITDDIVLTNNAFSVIKLDHLQSIGDRFSLQQEDRILELDLPALQHSETINVNFCDSLEFVSMASLLDTRSISITSLPELTRLNFGNLIDIESGISQFNTPELTELDLSSLQTVGNSVSFTNIEITELSLSNLISIGSFSLRSNSRLRSIDLSSLTSFDQIRLSNNLLFELNMSGLKTITGDFDIQGNSLSSINLDSLITISSDLMDFSASFRNNGMSSELVNYILAQLANIDPPVINSSIDLFQSRSTSAPTGQGLVDLAKLRNNGNTVLTD